MPARLSIPPASAGRRQTTFGQHLERHDLSLYFTFRRKTLVSLYGMVDERGHYPLGA